MTLSLISGSAFPSLPGWHFPTECWVTFWDWGTGEKAVAPSKSPWLTVQPPEPSGAARPAGRARAPFFVYISTLMRQMNVMRLCKTLLVSVSFSP